MTILLACSFDADDWAQWMPALEAALPGERYVTQADEGPREAIDVAIVANPPAGSLAGLPRLALIQSLWAGVDRLLEDATLPDGVPIARMVDPAMNAAMAETALWAVLGLHRGYLRYQALQREARWEPHGQRRADEVSVAVLGLGEMGATAARRIASLGYRVSGWSRGARSVEGIETRSGFGALPGVLAAADVVINLLPLTPGTRDLFDAARFAQMKPGCGFVNLARGAHVVDDALLAALAAGRVGHAVLDVFRREPLPAAHAYWRHPQVTMLPHAAAQTDARSAAQVAAANVRALRRNEAVSHLVDRSRGY